MDNHARKIIEAVVDQRIEVVLSSYVAAEVVTVLRRLAREKKVSATVLERDAWAIWSLSSVTKDFNTNISKSLLHVIREQPAILILAKILELEPKDVPLIILAYKYKYPLITMDKRSLWDKRHKIANLTEIDIILGSEFKL